ncbi:hypothetical protein BAZOLSSOX_1388 [uncultured Gammaproteobacteria bacterium]|nr:hypothetical protein BAZOLSSOX_1388 [uncultured Gammaproteobacteria bacterium]
MLVGYFPKAFSDTKTQSFDWVFYVLLILIRRVVYKIDKDNFSN